ncbi:MDR family NADP-dependent oxidoreductase [Myceligenerans pegani]|uniref:NADP-dependent oxidoreductase n=1 Tax=Myceligenerans pegani TaxID=2776917 RepID=A0ABR9N569_9MICO|nr:NADP-dependent oxidoreductase [Myceligenerans sp. TRM 65318]MBE1878817.1 NADP-dependent oxidoreductase [Myceligenerans sp. TRM 65318]MBE3021088.1 NADP-dependent oxidoreductase [Myceligenerans sp. TRM 65318]
MTVHGNSAVVLRAHRTNRDQPPSSLLEVTTLPPQEPAAGQVRVRNTYQHLIAATGDLMFETTPIPVPPFRVGEPLYGVAIGEVVESRSDDLPVGAVVQHMAGWREESILGPGEAFPVPDGVFPGPEYLLNQGVPAYYGMVDVAGVGEGDVVLVSGAAGSVGSMAAQIAKARGAATVIGVAGGPEKARYLVDDLGLDAAIDHRNSDLDDRLTELAPGGITVFFDTVGGPQFEAALRHAAPGARFALAGTLAGQVGGGDGGHPRLDIMTALVREVQIRPFSTRHTPEQVQAWNTHYAQWYAEGRITFAHTLLDGDLHRVIAAQDELLAGVHRGNVIVRLAG